MLGGLKQNFVCTRTQRPHRDWARPGFECLSVSNYVFNLYEQYIMFINLYAEHIMWNARLDEAQAVIKIPGRNINNLRYADDTTLMAESEEELKSLLMKVK